MRLRAFASLGVRGALSGRVVLVVVLVGVLVVALVDLLVVVLVVVLAVVSALAVYSLKENQGVQKHYVLCEKVFNT